MAVVYLNNAATTYPKPQAVIDATLDALTGPPGGVDRSVDAEADERPLPRGRAIIGRFLGASQPESITFSSGATESLNLVIYSLVERDRSVVTTVTEHNSVLRPLERMRRERNARVVPVTCDQRGYVDPSAVAHAIDDSTACVVVNHEIGRASCRERVSFTV